VADLLADLLAACVSSATRKITKITESRNLRNWPVRAVDQTGDGQAAYLTFIVAEPVEAPYVVDVA
jgi:hypothetical protein